MHCSTCCTLLNSRGCSQSLRKPRFGVSRLAPRPSHLYPPPPPFFFDAPGAGRFTGVPTALAPGPCLPAWSCVAPRGSPRFAKTGAFKTPPRGFAPSKISPSSNTNTRRGGVGLRFGRGRLPKPLAPGCWLLAVAYCLLAIGYWLLANKRKTGVAPRK
jgi:hypothetical protein